MLLCISKTSLSDFLGVVVECASLLSPVNLLCSQALFVQTAT